MANNYGAVLRREGAARLLGSALAGRLPTGMSALAILLLVRESTGSYAAAGFATGCNALASAVCGPVLGRLIDRFGRRLVIGPTAALQACVYVLLALSAGHVGAAVLIVGAGVAGALMPPIASVVRAMLGDLYEDNKVRETAYGLEAIAQETIWVVGPLLNTVIVTVASPRLAVLLLGVIGIVGTAVFMSSPLVSIPISHERATEPEHAGSALRSRDLRWMLLPVAAFGAGMGAIEVGLPSLALHEGSRSDSGVLLALWSVGSMLGGIRYSSSRKRGALGSRYALLTALNVVAVAPLLLASSIPLACIFSVIAGVAIAPAVSCQYSLVARIVLPGTEHEAFSWVLSAVVAGIAIGSAPGGALITPVGIMAPFALSCLVAALGAVAALRFRGRFATAEAEPAHA